MDDFELKDMMGTDVNQFVKTYRDILKRQYDAGLANLQNTKRQQDAKIMGSANTAGMMYSNFPQRSKMQYEAQSYTPAVSNLHNTYQTGLDKLRSNAVSTYNQIKSYQEAIKDLNES